MEVTFHLGATPLITSPLCRTNCRRDRAAHCCARARPRFRVDSLFALAFDAADRLTPILESYPCSLYLDEPYLIVERDPLGACALWTPEGCVLPGPLRPEVCRHYFCRLAEVARTQQGRAAAARYDAVVRAVSRERARHQELWTRVRRNYAWLNRHLVREANGGFVGAGRAEVQENLLATLRAFEDGYRAYRRALAERVTAVLGRESVEEVVKDPGRQPRPPALISLEGAARGRRE
ncbi:MAG: hypothetical protein QMC81_09885 [Thermoanaerobacterales bacterium]|nr:hypothetical protein [Bacillota bacterium]MDI6907774.1 hypothetical protein [Thermoanaerobacterales bacterium]